MTDFILPRSKPNGIRELVRWMSKISNLHAQVHPLPPSVVTPLSNLRLRCREYAWASFWVVSS